MRSCVLGAVAAVALSPAIASATTFFPVTGNQGFIAYDHAASNVALGNFNLSTGAVALTALFSELDTAGALGFGVFTNPLGPGAVGSLNINLTRLGTSGSSPGTDNESFQAFFAGTELLFERIGDDFFASFDGSFESTSDVLEFQMTFAGFDPGDQFQINVAQVASVPLPAGLPLLLLAISSGFILTGRRRRAPS